MEETTKLDRLDKLDRKILSILLSNGRESIANLSRSVGLSRTAISERINRLEKAGTIRGYTAQLQIDSKERRAISYLLISCHNGQRNEVSKTLKGIPEIRNTCITGGEYDIIARLEASDLYQIHILCDKIENISGISELQTSVVLYQSVDR
ncbi:Lrp/AsnC family transcriptional regulator [Moritella viscosa]|uniref:HTH-type transcriptional regulator n=1 Tax=Moritella viscosa TaxID=80854 RepID=A0A090IKD8_9GAMM|nr:Lrp/AsnC family transcriptional regulator [Moritella viscosa]CED60744.1 HTH-type transcriptional regulator, AsnC family [Moritella viscosa]SGY96652.1 Putative HTH-type transcriptional regulator [Moritella viscosa]SGZ02385.1 Putative HTH-type transcriptional regulator [Moritella viscosa]SGZ02958.1 Putative HTH-type transcriptional regulator [Moritella viscosa]SGZ09403.1 Putative HTH-type transcriptional regulator [Moritella viscosa]